MEFEFGSFNAICRQVPLPLCAYIGTPEGIATKCYGRSISIFGYPVLQASTLIVHVVALLMTAVMIFNIRSKYTAVGRKEIIMFFYLFMAESILEILVTSNIIPMASSLYPYFAASHIGLVSAVCWCLLLNGFVGFQFAEDGTAKSVWFLRLSSLFVFGAAFFIATATFNEWAGFQNTTPMALWIVYFDFNAICVVLYIILQMVLTLNTLEDRWPLGDIIFGTLFAALAQISYYVVSLQVCQAMNRYMDGTFFAAICNLFAVMMVYKYWDSITKEDLEFSVGESRGDLWEVKELLDDSEAECRTSFFDPSSAYYPSAPTLQQAFGTSLYSP